MGAGVSDVDRICHDELRLCARVMLVPEASRSNTSTRSSGFPFPRMAAVELEGDLEAALLELVEGF